ncbi:uncharacterized protein LOC115919439 [Strongylocentrotus purpuratus]|uniref:Uncharacterized protein n=1 Tax=Strongylocentrotus purpuratus TaxID=7668 RepID=A0A7M7MZX4_STRPU|nr:uncharacterized protein LOC115919439 [Strongylocentrotus purpuratus]
MEDLIDDVTKGLKGCSIEGLIDVLTTLGLPEDKVSVGKERGRSELVRLVKKHLYSDEMADSEDRGEATWKMVADAIGTKGEVMETKQETEVASSPLTIGRAQPETTPWRREFKISGQVGEAGQRERLSFMSLIHQIERGKERGYADEEIVDAVIRAMAPGLTLRAYLESKPQLNLPTLRRLIRSHYQEKEAMELYHELSRAAQGQRESAHDFLLRLLALKQKIMFVSKEAGSSFHYNGSLVENMFRHSALTGILNEGIRNDMKPYLNDSAASDEDLLEKVNLSANNETERLNKHKRRTPAQVNTVQETPEAKIDMNSIHKEIKALIRAEIAAIRDGNPAPVRESTAQRDNVTLLQGSPTTV